MSDLVIPGSAAPNNLHFGPNVKAAMVESDMYNICERIKEVSEALFILELEDEETHGYVIMEKCPDGVERMVCKCKQLDQRIIGKLQYMRSVPFEHRFAVIEAELDKEEAEEKERQKEEMYERVGAPMLRELEACGFVDRNSKTILPLKNKTAQRHANAHSKLQIT